MINRLKKRNYPTNQAERLLAGNRSVMVTSSGSISSMQVSSIAQISISSVKNNVIQKLKVEKNPFHLRYEMG